MTTTMRALVRGRAGVTLADVPTPTPGAGEVVVDVAIAGVCRSDLAAIDGTVAVPEGRILGHELAGTVDGVPVAVIPFAPCGACASCATGRCSAPRWLGVDRDGAFAEQVAVPAVCVLPLPRGMSLVHGAYVEPVAAAFGVLPSVPVGAHVLVAGTGRIAELTARVLAAHGARVARDGAGPFDVAIEHAGNPAALLECLRPGGTLVLKSRASTRVAFDAAALVARDLTIRGASHGSFAAAIDWLHAGRIAVDDLLAAPRPLEAFAEVLAAARASEAQKQMLHMRDHAPGGPDRTAR